MSETSHRHGFGQYSLLRVLALLCLVASAGCTTEGQFYSDSHHRPLGLDYGLLKAGGIGFLTPATPTGLEADKQGLALGFAESLKSARPGVRVVPLPDILSAVNRSNLTDDYKRIYRDYLETGILEQSILQRIGDAGNVRYLAQLSLGQFVQESRGRFSVIGMRLIETKRAALRVFLQIWDSQTGEITWEASEELNLARDTSRERPVTFAAMVTMAAENLYAALPGAQDGTAGP
jgi:hypothetical protein